MWVFHQGAPLWHGPQQIGGSNAAHAITGVPSFALPHLKLAPAASNLVMPPIAPHQSAKGATPQTRLDQHGLQAFQPPVQPEQGHPATATHQVVPISDPRYQAGHVLEARQAGDPHPGTPSAAVLPLQLQLV